MSETAKEYLEDRSLTIRRMFAANAVDNLEAECVLADVAKEYGELCRKEEQDRIVNSYLKSSHDIMSINDLEAIVYE